MRTNKSRNRNEIGANAGNIGTGSNHEILTHSGGLIMGIITQERADRVEHFRGKCAMCGREAMRLFNTKKNGGRQACIECLFPMDESEPRNRKLELKAQPVDKPAAKVVRLFDCFGCGAKRSADLMSGLLVICRDCSIGQLSMDEPNRDDFAKRTISRLLRFLRRRL